MRKSPKSKSKSKKKYSSNSKSKSKSLCLSVYEENVVIEEQAVPLSIYDPRSSGSKRLLKLSPEPVGAKYGKQKMQDQNCLRRSPRLSALPDLPPAKKKAKGTLGNGASRTFDDVKCVSVRRSPRFASPAVQTEDSKTLVQHKKYKGGSKGSNADEEKDTVSNVESLVEKCIRGSPRLMMNQSEMKSHCLEVSLQEISLSNLESPENGCFRAMSSKTSNAKRSLRDLEDEPTPLSGHGYGDKEPMPLRRSPRLISDTENNVSESLKSFGIEKLDEKPIRKSPRFSSCVAGDKLSKIASNFIGLSDPKDERPSKKIMISLEKSDLRIFGDKRFRQSPGRSTSMFEAERRETECGLIEFPETFVKQPPKKMKTLGSSKKKQKNFISTSLIGDPISNVEAQERWGWRYQMKEQRYKSESSKLNEDEEDEIILNVECHFAQAKIGNCIFSLGDCAYIKGNGGKKEVGRILEFFKTTDGENYFRVQWFYRVEDTVIKEEGTFHDKRRLFYSTIMNDNLIDCIISKVSVTQISPKVGLKVNSIVPFDFYYDMEYCVEYSTFRSLVTDNSHKSYNLSSCKTVPTLPTAKLSEDIPSSETYNAELALLDLYCGCGGMSTGLCLGAKLSCVNLVTKWALDSDKSACESLKLNHPDTHVRNEAAEDFLELLKEWEKFCKQYEVNDVERTHVNDVERTHSLRSKTAGAPKNDNEIAPGEYEVSKFVDICYGDPNNEGKRGVNFKVRWKGYDSSEDTWEPIESLSNCQESIQEFVRNGRKLKILPLPGGADIICGGPPCQGISGYNRYRNVDSPLDDERNRQIVVFMDIVNFLKPKYVLMENVVDILRFDKASLGRYALSRLVHMNYQARLGIIAAGCYGLPQFRLRVFLWGANPCENLPQFPLPTHDVIIRYWPPSEFERNTVAYDEDQPRELEEALILQDAISDLPTITNDETREEMSFQKPPETDFQRYIRSTQYEMIGSALEGTLKTKLSLYDHRPYPLFEDDYLRVCQIPKRKGANFRDLPGVVVGKDNVARRDSTENYLLLPSGKPLVPDYAFTFEQGKSKRPFARLWWDETVPTVLTFPSCHNQQILHPEQDRILTVRECARLQGFPDYYRFCGTVKERYCQVGNAVSVSVARALGYALGLAVRKLSGNEPLMTLPHKFSHSNYFQFTKILPLEIEEY